MATKEGEIPLEVITHPPKYNPVSRMVAELQSENEENNENEDEEKTQNERKKEECCRCCYDPVFDWEDFALCCIICSSNDNGGSCGDATCCACDDCDGCCDGCDCDCGGCEGDSGGCDGCDCDD